MKGNNNFKQLKCQIIKKDKLLSGVYRNHISVPTRVCLWGVCEGIAGWAVEVMACALTGRRSFCSADGFSECERSEVKFSPCHCDSRGHTGGSNAQQFKKKNAPRVVLHSYVWHQSGECSIASLKLHSPTHNRQKHSRARISLPWHTWLSTGHLQHVFFFLIASWKSPITLWSFA